MGFRCYKLPSGAAYEQFSRKYLEFRYSRKVFSRCVCVCVCVCGCPSLFLTTPVDDSGRFSHIPAVNKPSSAAFGYFNSLVELTSNKMAVRSDTTIVRVLPLERETAPRSAASPKTRISIDGFTHNTGGAT